MYQGIPERQGRSANSILVVMSQTAHDLHHCDYVLIKKTETHYIHRTRGVWFITWAGKVDEAFNGVAIDKESNTLGPRQVANTP